MSTNLPASRPPGRQSVTDDQMREYLRRARAGADEKFSVPFYSADAKARLVDEHTVLYLSALKSEDGKFGPRWVLTLHEDGPDGSPGLLTLPDNSWRTIYFGNLQVLLTKLGKLGPLQLTMRQTRNGETFDLAEWSEEPSPVDDPDDLPF